MAKPQSVHDKNKRDDKRPAPRLYLVTPVIEDAAAFSGTLRDALAAADVAAVLLRLKPAGERDLINRIKVLAPLVQEKDIALLLNGLAELVARAGADGAHLTGIEAFMAAVDSLKPAKIAGCGGVNSRHDSMLAGERRADYVMMGTTRSPTPAVRCHVQRIEWWSDWVHGARGICGNPLGIALLPAAGRFRRQWRSRGRSTRRACRVRGATLLTPEPGWMNAKNHLAAMIGALPRRQGRNPVLPTPIWPTPNISAAATSAPSRRRCGGSRRKTIRSR